MCSSDLAAELLRAGKEGPHAARFSRLLETSVRQDRQIQSPEFLGYNGDFSDRPTDSLWPRNAFGQPDLEGIWTSDDMKGVPMARPAQYGNRAYLSDEEFAKRARDRANARVIDDARTGRRDLPSTSISAWRSVSWSVFVEPSPFTQSRSCPGERLNGMSPRAMSALRLRGSSE